MQISISISEPWELGESISWKSLAGELIQAVSDEHGGQALIKLDSPLNYRDSAWRYLVAKPRHQGDQIAPLQTGKKVFCALTGISDQQASSNNPLDIGNWRGGLAFIGDVEPANTP